MLMNAIVVMDCLYKHLVTQGVKIKGEIILSAYDKVDKELRRRYNICCGTTAAGKPCERRVKRGNNMCWQHVEPPAVEMMTDDDDTLVEESSASEASDDVPEKKKRSKKQHKRHKHKKSKVNRKYNMEIQPLDVPLVKPVKEPELDEPVVVEPPYVHEGFVEYGMDKVHELDRDDCLVAVLSLMKNRICRNKSQRTSKGLPYKGHEKIAKKLDRYMTKYLKENFMKHNRVFQLFGKLKLDKVDGESYGHALAEFLGMAIKNFTSEA